MMSPPAISKHLPFLENAGLVPREKRGQSVHYGLKGTRSPARLRISLLNVPSHSPVPQSNAAAARRKGHWWAVAGEKQSRKKLAPGFQLQVRGACHGRRERSGIDLIA
jgi:DNA-binding transcriptional ArsR family regulator